MNRLHCLLVLAALAAAGCGPPPVAMAPTPPPPAPVPVPAPPVAAAPVAQCNADAAQFVLGKVLDAALTEQARTQSGAQRVRVVRPGQMVTMEFDEKRLTLQLDASDRVTAARCG